MKVRFILLIAILHANPIFSQNDTTSLQEKATVYFTRASGLGALINFTYFDGETPIGRFNGPKYLKYKCSLGEHLFWARSENKSFVEANLEPGGIYLIDVIPQMGGFKASVKLVPVDKNNYKLKKIQKLVTRREPETFNENQLGEIKNEADNIVLRGIERYNKLKQKNSSKIAQLKSHMTITEKDLIFVKKKK